MRDARRGLRLERALTRPAPVPEPPKVASMSEFHSFLMRARSNAA